MKNTSIYCAVALAAALALGAMAGCSSQPASSANASSESASATSSASASEAAPASESASAAAQKTQDEIIAELKESVANVPAYKSVTITEETTAWTNDDAEAADESSSDASSAEDAASNEADGTDDIIESVTVYKFDESGDRPKTSAAFEMKDVKMQYYTDGDDAVCVTDGPVYSGTVDQFGLAYAAGSDTYLKETIGDLNAIIDCASSVTQNEIDGVTGYELTLDPEKYIESDEILKLMADSGSAIQEAYITVGFDKDGRIVWMTKTSVFPKSTTIVMMDLADFDNTTVDPMPEATKTYEEMEADMKEKLDAFASES